MTHDERVTRLAEQMADEALLATPSTIGNVLRPYAAAMVQAEEALEHVKGCAIFPAVCEIKHAQSDDALAALRALEAK